MLCCTVTAGTFSVVRIPWTCWEVSCDRIQFWHFAQYKTYSWYSIFAYITPLQSLWINTTFLWSLHWVLLNSFNNVCSFSHCHYLLHYYSFVSANSTEIVCHKWMLLVILATALCCVKRDIKNLWEKLEYCCIVKK